MLALTYCISLLGGGKRFQNGGQNLPCWRYVGALFDHGRFFFVVRRVLRTFFAFLVRLGSFFGFLQRPGIDFGGLRASPGKGLEVRDHISLGLGLLLCSITLARRGC